jgi:hypothetical protein
LEEHAGDVYEAIIEADRQSRERFSGHGSALAQAYNHMILPLANRRDKYTQILWGIRDFEHRFGRQPEGMWLPETAVDLETLDVLAELGIAFTVLSPYQANRVRPSGKKEWRGVSNGTLDPTMPYIQQLPSGRAITIFFYDGPISRAVAFERLLKNGKIFAKRLISGFNDERKGAQLVHIAADGETYGHHQRFGDMALAYALEYIEVNRLARLTNYGEYLAKNPPTHEVEIFENTSWSCVHGIERWRSDCGCNSGQNGDWNQAWREPLRNALDWLRDALARPYEERAKQYLKDPWQARNGYVDVVINRSPHNVDQFLARHSVQPLTATDKINVIKLLEMQRQLMLEYTSCGWYFDELSGIETVQVIQYAGRAIQLANELFGNDIEPRFLDQLEQAKSNIPEHSDGRRIYERFVQPAMVDLKKVAAHFAISSLFEDYAEVTPIFCYSVSRQDCHSAEAGKAKVAVGQVTNTSDITQETAGFQFGVLHLGGHNLTCGIAEDPDDENYQNLVLEVFKCFDKADFPEVLRVLDKYFEDSLYSMTSLFRDEQRKILDLILETTLADTLSVYRHLYEHNVPLMRFLKDSGTPSPRPLHTAGEFVVNSDLHREFSRDELDHEIIAKLIEDADLSGLSLDADTLEYTLRANLEHLAERFGDNPEQSNLLEKLLAGVELVYALPFDVNLRKVQNIQYDLGQRIYPKYKEKTANGDEQAGRWVDLFDVLSEKLWIRFE